MLFDELFELLLFILLDDELFALFDEEDDEEEDDDDPEPIADQSFTVPMSLSGVFVLSSQAYAKTLYLG